MSTVSSDEIRMRLQQRYEKGWLLFHEVHDPATNRYIDTMAVGLWGSRNFELHGFEIKVSRSDWLTELRNPKKAEHAVLACDKWYLVTAKNVVKKDELPDGWGLIVQSGAGLRQAVPATSQKDSNTFPRGLIAVLLRHMHTLAKKAPSQKVIENAVIAARNAQREYEQRNREWEVSSLKSSLEKLKARVKDFEDASGLSIHGWQHGKVGQAVHALVHSNDEVARVVAMLERDATELGVVEHNTKQHLEAIKQWVAERHTIDTE